MRAKVTSTATGDVLLESVLVVTTHEGRLGFCSPAAGTERVLTDPEITLTGPRGTISGLARVVRSGTAYEEVRGRTREVEGLRARWASRLGRRGRGAVVLVDVIT